MVDKIYNIKVLMKNIFYKISIIFWIYSSILKGDEVVDQNLILNLCSNINGGDFRIKDRPSDLLELDLSDSINPQEVLKCVNEFVENNIIFSHEINGTSTISMDLNRKNQDGDLNDYSFHLQNIRRVLTNKFGDQITLFDFNRFQSVDYNFTGSANISYKNDCEGWLSFPVDGHSYLTFRQHLKEETIIPNIRHSFVDFRNNEELIVDDFRGTFFGLSSSRLINVGNNLHSMANFSYSAGRSYEQSFLCRFYFSDLVKFANGNYVQNSDMKKINNNGKIFDYLDSLQIGVTEEFDIPEKSDFIINSDIKEFVGFPRVLITNPRNIFFKTGEFFIKSLGLVEKELIYGTDFSALIKEKLDWLQDKLKNIKYNSCQDENFITNNQNEINSEFNLLNLALDLSFDQNNCLKNINPFIENEIELDHIYENSSALFGQTLFSPGYFLRTNTYGENEYLQPLWVKGTKIVGIDNQINKLSDESCPELCIGDLPCLRSSYDGKFVSCVPNSVELLTGCQTLNNLDGSLARCMAITNISSLLIGADHVGDLDILNFFNSFEYKNAVIEEDFNNMELEKQIDLLENADKFFDEISGVSTQRYGLLENEFLVASFVTGGDEKKVDFSTIGNIIERSCSENYDINKNAPFLYFPFFESNNQLTKASIEDAEVGSLICLEENDGTIKMVSTNVTCNEGIVNPESRCLQYPKKEFNCGFLNPIFYPDNPDKNDEEDYTYTLQDYLKFEHISPGIILIHSYKGEVSADYSDHIEGDPAKKNNVLKTYLFFEDERNNVSNYSSFLFDKNVFRVAPHFLSILDEGNPSYRNLNQLDIKNIIEYMGLVYGGEYNLADKLLELNFKDSPEFYQRVASCVVADFLFNDFEISTDIALDAKNEIGCYLESKSSNNCLGKGDIRYFDDDFSFHPQYLALKEIDQVGYPINREIDLFTDRINYLALPTFDLSFSNGIVNYENSPIIDTSMLQNKIIFPKNDCSTTECLRDINLTMYDYNLYVKRKFSSSVRDPLSYYENNDLTFGERYNLIITGESNCLSELDSADQYTEVHCFPDRMRVLTLNNIEGWSLFDIKGYDSVKISNLDIEVLPDFRLLSFFDEFVEGFSSSYLSNLMMSQYLMNNTGAAYPYNLDINILEFEEFLNNIDQYYDIYQDKFLCGELEINPLHAVFENFPELSYEIPLLPTSSYLTDLSLELWILFFENFKTSVGFCSELNQFVLNKNLKNHFFPNVFSIVDNGYVEISDIKINGAFENFLFLRGNNYHEIDGIVYKENEKVVSQLDAISVNPEIKNSFYDMLKIKNKLIKVDNGDSIYFKENEYIKFLDKYFLSNGFPLNLIGERVLGLPFPFFDIFNILEGDPFLSHDAYPYYLENDEPFNISDSFFYIPYLNDNDFNLNFEKSHLDIGDYSYRRQCYRNLNITQCENLEDGSCDLFETCISDESCGPDYLCHPNLFYCTYDCENNIENITFGMDIDLTCDPLKDRSDDKGIRCVDNYCMPSGCENESTVLMNSTISSCGNNSDTVSIELNHVNGLIFNNNFEKGLKCEANPKLKINDNGIGIRISERRSNQLRVERNHFNSVDVVLSGIGEGFNSVTFANNLFFHSKFTLFNEKWRTYWLNNYFYNIDQSPLSKWSLFTDKAGLSYYWDAPFYGTHLFKNNIFDLDQGLIWTYYPIESQTIYDISEEEYKKRTNIFIVKNKPQLMENTFGRPFKFSNSVYHDFDLMPEEIFDDGINLNFENVIDEWLTDDENSKYLNHLRNQFDSPESIISFLEGETPCDDSISSKEGQQNNYLFRPILLDSSHLPLNYLVLKGHDYESRINDLNDHYSNTYFLDHDYFGKRRKIATNHGPIEERNFLIKCRGE